MRGLRLFKGLCLLFLPNVPGATFIQGGTFIPDSRVQPLIKNPIKDTLVPLRTNFNANGSVRWRTSLYLNLFHWPMGKNSGNGKGVCSSLNQHTYT